MIGHVIPLAASCGKSDPRLRGLLSRSNYSVLEQTHDRKEKPVTAVPASMSMDDSLTAIRVNVK